LARQNALLVKAEVEDDVATLHTNFGSTQIRTEGRQPVKQQSNEFVYGGDR